ncbi:MAG: type II toxin-antitoxin system Phd/YefM family antitoxin [Candidatus Aminicenantes bacterium]|nr:type II toxin-antitoxin system Phd/YefM family antitoxin [Candidatus Aminicenantes bacterium]
MNKIIGVTDLQRKFKKAFDEVAEEHVPYILTRGSRPEAALIPYDLYLKYLRADEEGVLKRFDEVSARMAGENAKYSAEDIDRDVKAARKAVRPSKRR